MSTTPTRDDYVRELSHKHQLIILNGLLFILLFCICIIFSTNAHKLQLLTLVLALVVFYGALLHGIMVKTVNRLVLRVNQLTLVVEEVRARAEQR